MLRSYQKVELWLEKVQMLLTQSRWNDLSELKEQFHADGVLCGMNSKLVFFLSSSLSNLILLGNQELNQFIVVVFLR